MQLAGEQRGEIVMKEPERLVAAHRADIRRSAGGRADVDLDLDGEHFRRSRRETDRVQNAGKTDEGAVDRSGFPDAPVDLVALRRQVAADRAQTATQAVAGRLALPSEVEVFGVARQAEEEAQAGSALEGERGHRPGALKRPEDAGLQVLAGEVSSPQR